MEDEDLELLRKAALQSLQKKNSKPQIQETQQIQPVQTIQQPPQALNPRAPPFIPAQVPPVSQQWNNFGSQPVVMPPINYIPPHVGPPMHPQFMPNMMPTPPGVPVNVPLSIVPPVIAPTHVPNVQLSPRSAAFVSQNNDIIRRRCRSPYRNASPGRWSPSPPRQRRHSRSKSPLPPQRNYRDKSLSPGRRDRNGRWNPNQSRGNSPSRRHRSRSPRRSPPRKRSNSKSPGRRLNRNYNNNNNNNNGRRPLRRNSPPPRNGKDRNRDASPALKKRKSEEKRKTPEKAKSRSKSRSLSPGADLAAVLEKLDDDYDMFPILDETEPDIPEETIEVTKVEQQKIEEKPKIEILEEKKPEPIAVKKSIDDVNEDELLGMSDDEISLGGNDIELDDLFNSDDSESENEGRFKSGARNSSNKAKPTPVLPFSKLGASSSSTTVTSELTPNERKDRNDDRRRREDTGRRDWRSRTRQESRKIEENPKEESVVKKFKPLVDDKKRSNTPEVRVPSISSTVKTVAKETTSPPEKRTIQLKRPITANKDDSKVKENITITTGGNLNSQKKEEPTNGSLVRTSIRSRLGGKVDEKDTKPSITTRTPISAPSTTTTKTVRTKITWKSEKV